MLMQRLRIYKYMVDLYNARQNKAAIKLQAQLLK